MRLRQITPRCNAHISASTSSDLIERTRQLKEPKPYLVGTAARTPTDQELRSGRFLIENRPVFLRAPVDWIQDPFQRRSWQFQLNTLTWLKPLLRIHDVALRRVALTIARDLVVDWARSHKQQDTQNEFAWYDMAVGLRCAYIAYVLRACLTEDMIDKSDAALLLEMAVRHGNELAKPENYSSQHNHGLYQDEGLYLLTRQLPLLPSASTWRDLALERLRFTLSQTICFSEGGHLEHSSSYQFAVTGLVSRLAENVPELDGLTELQNRLKATSAWHVTPANRMVQLGDTDDIPPPEWACEAASDLHGINPLYNTGQAFVREANSYLAVSAAHHGVAHKQADETGFILIENGIVILGDAGRWGYYEKEPDRIYARSAAAHNVLAADDLDFQWRHTVPYGSGLVAAGQSNDWYGIVAKNPSLHHQGITHRRLLLYRPKHILLIIDEVQSGEQHNYVRHFHFGPQVIVKTANSCLTLTGDGLSASFTSHSAATTLTLHRGLDTPTRLGWNYPAERTRQEVSTAALTNRESSAVLVASVTFKRKSKLTAFTGDVDRCVIELDSSLTLEVCTNPDQGAVQILAHKE